MDKEITSLFQAARLGLHKEIERLIAADHSVRNVDNRGYTPLHEAIRAGELLCAEILLQQEECDPDAKTHEGYTSLYLASRHQSNPELILLLVKYGADVNLPDNEDVTPLHELCRFEKRGMLTVLLDSGAETNKQDFNGCTPLHWAVGSHILCMVSELLMHGANGNSQDMFGRSSLYLAAEDGWNEGIVALLRGGASINLCTRDGMTPLMAACQHGFESTVELLLDRGGDPNIESNNHHLAISLAVHNGYARLVRLLMVKTARDTILQNSLLAPDKMVSLPCLAIDGGSADCLYIIYEFGLGPLVNNAPIPGRLPHDGFYSFRCMSPLGFLLKDHILQPKAEEMVDFLLENGASVNAEPDMAMMPPVVGLCLAQCDKKPPKEFARLKLLILQKLLKKGCDIDHCSLAKHLDISYHLPDIVLYLCLFTDIHRNQEMLRVIHEMTISSDANVLAAWAFHQCSDLHNCVINILKDQINPSYSQDEQWRKFVAPHEVRSLQEISRLAARRTLWETHGSTARALEYLRSQNIPETVQRYLVGGAWFDGPRMLELPSRSERPFPRNFVARLRPVRRSQPAVQNGRLALRVNDYELQVRVHRPRSGVRPTARSLALRYLRERLESTPFLNGRASC